MNMPLKPRLKAQRVEAQRRTYKLILLQRQKPWKSGSLLAVVLGTLLLTAPKAHAVFDVLKTDKAQQGQDKCCSQGRCGVDFTVTERDRKGSGGSGNGNGGGGGVASDTISADSCYPAQMAALGATALYAGSVSYTVQATACTVACFASSTGAGPTMQKFCEYYGYASGALDAIMTYAITRSGEQLVQGLTGSLTGLGMNLMVTAGVSSSSSSASSADKGAKAEKKSVDTASCLRAVVAAGMAVAKYVGGNAAATEATRQYELKMETNNDGGTASRLAAYDGSTPLNANVATTPTVTSNPSTNFSKTTEAPPPAGPNAPSRDTGPATAMLSPEMDGFMKQTTGVGTGQLMESFATGVTPSQAIAALAGSQVGDDAVKLLNIGESLAVAAKLTPGEISKLEPSNAPKIPDYAYEAARSGATGGHGDAMPDLGALMAGIMEGITPPQGGKDGARGPAASGATVGSYGSGSAQSRLPGVHYLPAGDETTLFDLMNRSYSRLTARMLGFERSPAMNQINNIDNTKNTPSHPTSGAPQNPYLIKGVK